MTVKHQSSLVLEGGGSRGVFTAGVLDYLMEKEVKFPYVVGVSAGSCNALDYVSWQPGRTRDCMIIEDKANSYIATKEALKKHELFDMDMLFDKYPNELFPFDFDTFFQSDTECELVVTNCQTGDAEYMTEKHDRRRLMDIGRASSSIPVVSPMVEIDGVPYLDGGIADSIPIAKARQLGCTKSIVILTRPEEYRKGPNELMPLTRARYWRYPRLVEAMATRHLRYNATLDELAKLEQAGSVFVIRPAKDLGLGRTEKNLEKLTSAYRAGYAQAQRLYPALKAFLAQN